MRACPICGNGEKKVLYEYKLNLPQKLSFMPDTLFISVCERCGMVYTDSTATQETYDRYYETLHNYTTDKNTNCIEESEWAVLTRRKMLSVLEKYLDKDKYIIDIGTGNGGALKYLRKEAGCVKLLGIDLDEKEVFEGEYRDIEYRVGSVHNLAEFIEGKKCNIFILNGVLEHLFDVRGALDTICKGMDSESYLYIMVPNAEQYGDYYDKPYRYFGIEHINHFGPETMKNLLKSVGFELVEFGLCESNYNQYYVEPEIYFLVKKEVSYEKIEQYNLVSTLENNIIDYIKKSKEDKINIRISEIVNSRKEIAVWGVGSFLEGILENTNLLQGNIKYFIDNNKALQGTTISGIKIESPRILYQFEGMIVVSSAIYSNSIIEEISEMGIKNEVIVL